MFTFGDVGVAVDLELLECRNLDDFELDLDAAQEDLLRQLAKLRGEQFTEGKLAASGGVFAKLRDRLGNL